MLLCRSESRGNIAGDNERKEQAADDDAHNCWRENTSRALPGNTEQGDNAKQQAMRQSAPDATIAIAFRGMISLLNINKAKVMIVTTGQIQPKLAAQLKSDVVRDDVPVSMLVCSLTPS
ncbi:MAG: hypothetical protein AB9869_02080 [Verrucomicrobiia bacterium]